MSADDLIAYVNRLINSGTKEVFIPTHLLAGASNETLQMIRQLCKLAGVKISSR
jgi:hypothetical protein